MCDLQGIASQNIILNCVLEFRPQHRIIYFLAHDQQSSSILAQATYHF